MEKKEERKVEITIRSIYHGGQYAPALCIRTPGDRVVPCIFADVIEGIRVVMVPVQQHDKSDEVLYHGDSYPLKRHYTYLAHTARSYSCTAEAHRILSDLIPDFPPRSDTAAVRYDPGNDEDESAPKPKSSHKRPASTGPTVIGSVCGELGLDPGKARAALRKAGLSAPYNDREKVLAVLRKAK